MNIGKKFLSLLYLLFVISQMVYPQAPEPVSQPVNMLFTNVRAYSLVMSFTVSAADGYLILKSVQNISDVPVDGITYEKGQGLGSCKVMYVGANNIHNVREVLEGTKYYFKVFAYNGSGSSVNYLQTNPLTDSVVTIASDPGSYYALVDSSSPTFTNDLTSLINNHVMVAYISYRNNIVPAIFERDTTGARSVINCEYSNETTFYTPPFDFVSLDYSREHVLCKSWMQTYALYGSNVTDYPEGADYYNLLLTRLNGVNSLRSNRPLGIPVTGVQYYNQFSYGFDAGGKQVYAPRADRRGDAARAIFYEMICYNGLNGNWGLNNLLSFAGQQDQNILKIWNQQDPPDKFERTKNEFIYSIQHNRNPFIDHPDWVNCINFDSILKTSFCGSISSINSEDATIAIKVSPNPVFETLNIEFADEVLFPLQISVSDYTGRTLFQSEIRDTQSAISLLTLSNGIYFLTVSKSNQNSSLKFVIQH